MGVPVVSFASGGIPEAVAHGATGFLARERDWQALAGFMVRLLADRTSGRTRAWPDRNASDPDFDLRSLTRGLEDLYRVALREFPARALHG